MFFFGISYILIASRNRVLGWRITDIGCKGTKKKLYVQAIWQKSVFFICTLFEKWYKQRGHFCPRLLLQEVHQTELRCLLHLFLPFIWGG